MGAHNSPINIICYFIKKNENYHLFPKNDKHFVAIECNFYSWSGGKGIEVAGSYSDLQRRFNEKELNFIWITDGPGWKGMKNTLKSSFEDLDYLLNFKIFEKNFTNIINEINKEN
jgi:type II restriction enzyme